MLVAFYCLILFFCLIHLVLTLILFLECFASLLGKPLQGRDSEQDERLWLKTSVAVLIPAHNEEKVISRTLDSIIPQLKATDRIIVIADNCGDRTSEVAKEKGVKVIERKNEHLRGKGYAIDFGFKYLSQNPPEVVVMVDADCLVSEKTIANLTTEASKNNRPVQGNYLMKYDQTDKNSQKYGVKNNISYFALTVKNRVRSLGLSRLNLPCLLHGSGMAFPWQILKNVSFANSKTVDDMQLGIDFSISGFPPIYCSNSEIIGRLMIAELGQSQKTRWEHGHLEVILLEVPRLIQEGIKQKRLDLLILALDLAIPPLSLFVSLSIGFTIICLFLAIFAETVLPFLLSAIASSLIFISIIIAWYKFGREELSLTDLLKIPLYILWKIPLYFKFFWKRESQWIRTERD